MRTGYGRGERDRAGAHRLEKDRVGEELGKRGYANNRVGVRGWGAGGGRVARSKAVDQHRLPAVDYADKTAGHPPPARSSDGSRIDR